MEYRFDKEALGNYSYVDMLLHDQMIAVQIC